MSTFRFDNLKTLVADAGVAIRVRQRLQPAGGNGDKVFPPTYSTGDNALKYAVEMRRHHGAEVKCVLLDSVASQANRIEEGLAAAWEARAIDFPVIGVDFSHDPALADIGSITTLQAPHRIADAILRDATSADGKLLFRDTPYGRAFTDATTRNATAVFSLCPTALILGVWDSTGPKGGLGAKFQRALTSEIVAIGASTGTKVGSRIDPLGIQAGVEIFHRSDDPDDWTIDPEQARKDSKGKPTPFSRSGGDGKKGKPSSVNHSNIAPTIDGHSGGITFDHAMHTAVLSLAALRRLRFATKLDGSPINDRPKTEVVARSALAALALAGIANSRARGYDLRSRCLLVPDGGLSPEIVFGDGRVEAVPLDVDSANGLVKEANAVLASVGLAWEREPIRLKAAPKLVALVKRSREQAAAGDVGGSD